MRRTTLLLLTCTLALGAGGCADLTNEDATSPEEALTSENGLASNGLASNGLASNGLASNGLASNGLASNGLVMGALTDPASKGDLARMFFRYVISCALPAGHSVAYGWTDSSGVSHKEVNPGGLGLAPNWEYGAASTADKEYVSACLGARVNSRGISVPISLRAKGVDALAVSSTERSTYTYGEGAFWGNVFTSSPYLYSCSRSAFARGATASHYTSQGRTCTTAACGMVTPVGPCFASDFPLLGGQACFDRDRNHETSDWVSNCNPQKSSLMPSTSRVITTWLIP